jgi:RES domain-containing protein
MQQSLPLAVPWVGDPFRFTDMTYANLQDLFTGEGSRKTGGRWNPKGGFRTLYFSLTPETALAEILAHHRSQAMPDVEAMPVTLVGFRVNVRQLLDVTDRRIRRLLGVAGTQIREPWRPSQYAGREALTQAIGRLAREAGFQGLLAPSAVRRLGRNLVLFPERLDARELRAVHEERFPKFRRRLRRK